MHTDEIDSTERGGPARGAADAARIAELEGRVAVLDRQLELLGDYVSDGIWDWHIQSDYAYMSPRFWEIFGYAAHEMRHHPSEWQKIIDPRDLPKVLGLFEEHVRTRGEVPFDQQVRYRHKYGHWVTVRCRGRVIEWDAEGNPVRMVGSHTDLTDMIDARSRAEILYASATVGVWDIVDVDDDGAYWSPQFYRLLGHEVGALPATRSNFMALLHSEDRVRVAALEKAHFVDGTPFDVECRILTKSDGYRWFRNVGEAVRDANGVVRRFVGSIQDIHARRQTEEQLQVLTVRHQLSLQASKIGVWDWDVVENHIVWDEQMYGLYGISANDFGSAYEAWLAGVHPEDKDRGDAEIRAALENPETPFDTEFRVVHPSGEVRRIRAIAATIRDEAGQALRMVGVNWDITDAMRVQEELRRANDDLTQFAYRTSHDLKAPQATIESLILLCREDLEDGDYEEVQSNLDRVGTQASKLVALVHGILSLTRAELGSSTHECIAIRELLAEVVEESKDAFPASPVRASIDVRGDFDAPLDGVRLRQCIANLVSNSFKYFDPDKTESTLRIVAVDEGRVARFFLEDNGRGIPEGNRADVFKLFQRFHPDVASGSGLGMSFVKRYVDRMSGSIDFETSAQGTRFSISIPYRGHDEAADR